MLLSIRCLQLALISQTFTAAQITPSKQEHLQSRQFLL